MPHDLRKLFKEHIQSRLPDAGFEVLNAEGDTAEIRIYDVIGWPFIEAVDIAEQLDQITAPRILVTINSPGGSVFESIAIYNALRQHAAHITTRVDGIAASGASIIAQAGDHRIMVTASQMMIHKAWMLALGDSDEMAKVSEILAKQDSVLAGVYADRSDNDSDRDAYLELMTEETWMDADEAVAQGLADEVLSPPRKAEDRAPRKFSDQLRAVVTAIEQVATETENVVTFRSKQGKPPLSEDAVALLHEVEEATGRLTAIAVEMPDQSDDADAEVEYLRFVDAALQEGA